MKGPDDYPVLGFFMHQNLSDGPFTQVKNHLLNDPQLSWQAKGIAVYMVGRKKGWKLRVSDLVNRSCDGKHSIRSALNELRSAGYAKYTQERINGVYGEGHWEIKDLPVFPPSSDFPDAGKPDAGNQHLSNTDCTNTDLRREDTRSRKSVMETIETPHSLRERGQAIDGLDKGQQEIVDLYHEICVASKLGFLPVNKCTEELEKALSEDTMESIDELKTVFRSAVRHRKKGGAQNTLVQVLWGDYDGRIPRA